MIRLLKNIWKIEDEKHFRWVKFARYIISGGSATVINVGSLYFLVHFLHFWYLLATVVSYLFGIIASFVLQKFWTFRNASKENMHIQFVFFLFAGLFGLVLNTVLVFILVEYAHFHYLLAQVLCGILIAILNYFLYKELVFHKDKTEKIFSFLNKHKIKLIFLALLTLFFVLRLPGISLPYHQDEMKTAVVMSEGGEALKGIHHPPLTQMLYKFSGSILPNSLYRLFPLIFGALSLFIIFLFTKSFLDLRSAIWAGLLFSLSAYSVWASLMLDTDGVILPFFFIISFYFYYKWRSVGPGFKSKWFWLTCIFLVCGFLVKLSFIIPIVALTLDFIWENRTKITKKHIFNGSLYLIGFFVVAVVLMYFAKFFWPSFSVRSMISHALSFVNFGDRNYLQIAIQGIKAVFYSSPLLILPLLFLSKNVWEKCRAFFIAIFLGLIFYFILFDFSQGALDKYLMFFILPLSIICGAIIAEIFQKEEKLKLKHILFGIISAGALVSLNFLQHNVFPLYPKTDWFASAASLKWNFLFPLTGGSGPLGFYMSFLFISAVFILTSGLALIALFRKHFRYSALILIIFISSVYNFVFIEELVFGKINGDSTQVLAQSLQFIANTPDIKKVITYSSSGTFELLKMNKSGGRFYGVPGYEEGHKLFFEQNKKTAHFLVVDIPHLFNPSFYSSFFAECKVIFETHSRNIPGFVYDCKDADIIK